MTFFSLFCAYTIRVCLSIAITEMVNETKNHTTKSLDDTCPSPVLGPAGNATEVVRLASGASTYEWNEYQQVSGP